MGRSDRRIGGDAGALPRARRAGPCLHRDRSAELGSGCRRGPAAGMAASRGDAMDEPTVAPRRARRILILAPHPDDEVVACGIAARRAGAEGAENFVLFLTTGVPPREVLWRWQRERYEARIMRRRDEALAAAMMLGVQPVGFLDIPSRRLLSHLDEAAAAADRALAETRASELWVT